MPKRPPAPRKLKRPEKKDTAPSLTKPRFTEKQMAFMRHMVISNNQTESAIEAGYSPRSARSQGTRMMTNADIVAMIRKAQKTIADRQMVKAEDVIAHAKYVGLSNAFDYVFYDEQGQPYFDLKKAEERDYMLGAAINSIKIAKTTRYYKDDSREETVTTEMKLVDKKACLVMLNDATGALVDKNPGVAGVVLPKVEMHLHTNIPGSPGSKVRRVDPVVDVEALGNA